MSKLTPERASAYLQQINDGLEVVVFHRLSSAQIETVLAFADVEKYRKPKNANGSRARYFYQLLERRHNKGDQQ